MTSAVGLIGLGRIGGQLAANLLASGIAVHGCDIVAKPVFVAAGGRFAQSPAEIAEAASIILHSLPSVAALDRVIDDLAGHCGPRHVVADLSTYPLADKIRARDRLAAHGACLLDCQITGSPEMLAERRGVIFASGDRAAAARCEPIFAAAVARHFFVGEFGAATRLKTANNLLVALNTAAAAEALALAVEAGIDPQLAIDVIGAGAGQSQMFAQRAPLMAERRYEGKSSQLASFGVYLDLIEAALARSSLDAPLARAAVALYRRAITAGLGASDMACVYEFVNPPKNQTSLATSEQQARGDGRR
jgi:3-hydroxyisobutyrate dehydrogenase-like beta-hydroxyacid dehydrogenase